MGKEKRKRIGYGCGSFKDRTQEISLEPGMGVGYWMGVVRVTTPPSPRLFAFGSWAALGSLPPHDNLHPQIYIEVKEFPERGDRGLPLTLFLLCHSKSCMVILGLEPWARTPAVGLCGHAPERELNFRGGKGVSGLLSEASSIDSPIAPWWLNSTPNTCAHPPPPNHA